VFTQVREVNHQQCSL